jgi:hypothetical protein
MRARTSERDYRVVAFDTSGAILSTLTVPTYAAHKVARAKGTPVSN